MLVVGKTREPVEQFKGTIQSKSFLVCHLFVVSTTSFDHNVIILVTQESLIVDFFEYFREPWALAIFYDKFDCLRVENRATLLSKTVREMKKKKNVKKKVKETREGKRKKIKQRYLVSIRQAIPGQSLVNDCIRALMRSKWDEVSWNEASRAFETKPPLIKFVPTNLSRYRRAIFKPSNRDTLVPFTSKRSRGICSTFCNSARRICLCIARPRNCTNYT